jgi:hypothetical protein
MSTGILSNGEYIIMENPSDLLPSICEKNRTIALLNIPNAVATLDCARVCIETSRQTLLINVLVFNATPFFELLRPPFLSVFGLIRVTRRDPGEKSLQGVNNGVR